MLDPDLGVRPDRTHRDIGNELRGVGASHKNEQGDGEGQCFLHFIFGLRDFREALELPSVLDRGPMTCEGSVGSTSIPYG